MGWGRGGMVGVGKAIWEHDRTTKRAAKILEAECGKKHKLGERSDLCQECMRHNDQKKRREQDRIWGPR